MSSNIWTPAALVSSAISLRGRCWRIVEAQSKVSTMKLTDTLEEQELLEDSLKKQSRACRRNVSTSDICYLLRFDTNPIQPIRGFVAPALLKGSFMPPKWSKRQLRRPPFIVCFSTWNLQTLLGLQIQANTQPLLQSLPPGEPQT